MPAPLPSIQAVLGTDESEVKRIARELSVRLAPPGDFGCEIIDGAADNADQAAQRVHQTLDALQTFGLFGGEKLVWLRNATFLGEDRTSGAQATQEALEKLRGVLERGMPDGTRFLLSATAVDKRRSFYKTLMKIASVTVCDKIDNTKAGWEEKAEGLVMDAARRQQLRFSPDALALFTLFTGGDRRSIESEVEKFSLYFGGEPREITLEDVQLLTPRSRAGVVFELGNTISLRQLPAALELLRQLLADGESAIGILLASIIPTVRNLLFAKDLVERHKLGTGNTFNFGRDVERLGAAETAHLPRTKEGKLSTFQLGFAAPHVRRYSSRELRAALAACLAANVALVTSGTEPEVVLSQLLARIIAK